MMKSKNLWEQARDVKIQISSDIVGGFDVGFDDEIPEETKDALMRFVYRYFGESNSSVTITNLGNVKLPEQMQPFVRKLDCILTPRVHSPYGCAVISFGNILSNNISRFCEESELEAIFVRKLDSLLTE